MTEHRLHHILLALLLAITALMSFTSTVWAQGLSGTGTSTDPYLINDSIEWNWFAQSVTNDSTYAGKFVQLTDDIIVGTMAGIENKCFSGTFDGQGHTITLDMTATMQFTALFCYADGATFRNLKVDGVLNTSKKFCAGLVGAVVYHGCTFTNCVSDVTINSTVNGDGTHGGFVSYVWGANTFEGCAFTGKLLGPSTTHVGGFVGYTKNGEPQNGSVTFTNCLFIPEEVTMSGNGSQTFARWYSGDSAVTIGANCYYSQTLDGTQGKMMHSITGDANVTVAFNGQATNYGMSGIQAYNAGIVYDGTLYAGEGDTVSLNLSCEVPWGYVFEGSYLAEPNATLSGTANPYTLVMSNTDVRIVPIYSAYTVSTDASPNIYGAVQVSLDNATWGSSVTTSMNDVVYFRFNVPSGYLMNGFHIKTEDGVSVGYSDNHFGMPPSNVTVHADLMEMGGATGDVYTVTLSPGEGEGTPLICNSTVFPVAASAASAENLQFYQTGSTLGFRLDANYCPDSFTAPEGRLFTGWDGWSNNGYITLNSLATIFTAQWIEYEPYTVTLSPGIGGGDPIVYTSNLTTMAPNANSANTCQFYYVNNTTIGFRLPRDYCPNSFTAPEWHVFNGWDNWSNNGYITLTSTATTFTAQWVEFEPYTVTLSPGIGGGDPIVYAFNQMTAAPNANSANRRHFYFVNDTTIGFRLPGDYCPYSFTAPEGHAFIGWDGWNNNGYITLTSTATTFTAIWEDLENFTVTLSPGIGGGDPIVYTFDPTTAVSHSYLAETCQFYYDSITIGFRLPADYCPSSFVAPNGLQFLGWEGWNHNGYITLTSTSTTFTARWMIPINYIDGNGEMHTCTNYTVLTGGGTTTLAAGWYVVDSDITYSDRIKLNGDVTIILCNGKTMTVASERYNNGQGHTLAIYGQSLDSIEAGTFNVNCNDVVPALDHLTYIQHSGNVIVRSPNHSSAIGDNSFTINGGSLHASGKNCGIWTNYITINGGTVISSSTLTNGGLADLSAEYDVVINGGKVVANKIHSDYNTITLGWTNADDYILSGGFSTWFADYTVAIKSGQSFYYENDEGEQVIVSDTLNTDQINAIAGKTLRPYIVPTTVTQTVTLSAGANWFSTHLEITLDDLKAALVAALSGTNIVIKSKTQNAKYNGSSWRGNLTWDLSKMYLITVESACEITLEGEPINPADHPATILSGQSNWIAFPVNEEMTLSAAFAGFNAVNGDVVKSKTGNAKYNGSTWRATGLNKLEPGKGYLFNSASSQTRTLTFPSAKKQ